MNEYSKDTIKDLIYFLVTEGYITNVGNQFPILTLSPTSKDILFGDKKVFIKRKIEKNIPKEIYQNKVIKMFHLKYWKVEI